MELLEGVVGVKNQDSLHFTAGIGGFLREKIHHNAALRGFRSRFLVHFAPSGEQPFQIQGGVVQHQALQKIISGLIAAGKNMRDAAAGYGKSVCKFGLREVFGL